MRAYPATASAGLAARARAPVNRSLSRWAATTAPSDTTSAAAAVQLLLEICIAFYPVYLFSVLLVDYIGFVNNKVWGARAARAALGTMESLLTTHGKQRVHACARHGRAL